MGEQELADAYLWNRFLGRDEPPTLTLFPPLEVPLHWRKPRRVFVGSMSDLFHLDVPEDFIGRAFAVMALASQHSFQILTKRPQRMAAVLGAVRPYPATCSFSEGFSAEWQRQTMDGISYRWPLPNVWLGTSVEDQRYADLRIPHLLATPAALRFLSVEPLLGPVDLRPWLRRINGESRAESVHDWSTERIDWVIVGGESGPGARPMHPDWVRAVRDECQRWGVPFLFKQWGEWAPVDPEPRTGNGTIARPDGTFRWRLGVPPTDGEIAMVRVGKKAAGRELDGRTWDEYPDGGGQ